MKSSLYSSSLLALSFLPRVLPLLANPSPFLSRLFPSVPFPSSAPLSPSLNPPPELEKFVERGNFQVLFHLVDYKVSEGGSGYSKLFRDVLVYPGCYKASLLAATRNTVIKPGEDPVLGAKAVLRHASVSRMPMCYDYLCCYDASRFRRRGTPSSNWEKTPCKAPKPY